MAKILLDLKSRAIFDDGTIAWKHDYLIDKVRDGVDVTSLVALDDPKIRRFNFLNDEKLPIILETEDVGIMSSVFYEWNFPDGYKQLDIELSCINRLVDLNLDTDVYIARLARELEIIERLEMKTFLCCVKYVVDTIHVAGLITGVGRGSSCASLVLFLLNVHMVDPIRYDIPLEEFYKTS